MERVLVVLAVIIFILGIAYEVAKPEEKSCMICPVCGFEITIVEDSEWW